MYDEYGGHRRLGGGGETGQIGVVRYAKILVCVACTPYRDISVGGMMTDKVRKKDSVLLGDGPRRHTNGSCARHDM